VAFDHQERLEGLRCVAVPVLNQDDEIEGAISVSGSKRRMRGELTEKLIDSTLVMQMSLTYS